MTALNTPKPQNPRPPRAIPCRVCYWQTFIFLPLRFAIGKLQLNIDSPRLEQTNGSTRYPDRPPRHDPRGRFVRLGRPEAAGPGGAPPRASRSGPPCATTAVWRRTFSRLTRPIAHASSFTRSPLSVARPKASAIRPSEGYPNELDNVSLTPRPAPHADPVRGHRRAETAACQKFERSRAAIELAAYVIGILKFDPSALATHATELLKRANKVRRSQGNGEVVFVNDTAAAIRSAVEPTPSATAYEHHRGPAGASDGRAVMNAPIRSTTITAHLLASARALATAHDAAGRPGTAIALTSLVAEVETLREAAKGAVIVLGQASADLALAQLRSVTLLLIAEKLAPVIDQEIEQRQASGNDEDWSSLQALSDRLHAAIKLAKG